MSRITIIPSDGFVSIDGVQHFGVDMSAAPAGVRALQWQGNRGMVETDSGAQPITSLHAWMPILQRAHATAPTSAPEDPAPTPEQLRADRVAAVYAHLNGAAQALGYDDIRAAVTYADEPAVPKFQAEGLGLRAWRSLVWARCYQVLDEVQSGRRPIPTADELIAELPTLHIEYPAADAPGDPAPAD